MKQIAPKIVLEAFEAANVRVSAWEGKTEFSFRRNAIPEVVE